MRVLVPVVLALTLSLAAAAQDAAQPRTLDLSQPGVLEQLRKHDPDRYATIQDILKVSAQYPCQPSALRSLQARWDLKDVGCGALLKTSYPAQRVLSFELQGTFYTAHLVVAPGEQLQPAVESR